MRLALSLGARGAGQTWPNPFVGCVIVKNDEIIPNILGKHKGKVVDIDFSKDGKYLLTASWDGSIGYWDIEKRKNIRFIKGHKGPVYSVKFSEDNKY